LSLFAPRAAVALDKQSPAHQGAGADVPADGLAWSGQVYMGVLPYNPTYAARPDNSGHALLRAGAHVDVNLMGEHLFIPLDFGLFSDRDHAPALPSEIDLIGGVASTWSIPGGAVELGVRGEFDASADGRGASQKYVDVRGRYLFSLGRYVPAISDRLAGGDVSGWLTCGWFAWNPVYYARPDNTGRALLRYAAHADVGFSRRHFSVFVDATSFTDRTSNAVRPSELDLTVGATASTGRWAGQVAYERDMPIDGQGTGLVQHMVMVQGSMSFSGSSLGRPGGGN
jgi:hypothetical protein